MIASQSVVVVVQDPRPEGAVSVTIQLRAILDPEVRRGRVRLSPASLARLAAASPALRRGTWSILPAARLPPVHSKDHAVAAPTSADMPTGASYTNAVDSRPAALRRHTSARLGISRPRRQSSVGRRVAGEDQALPVSRTRVDGGPGHDQPHVEGQPLVTTGALAPPGDHVPGLRCVDAPSLDRSTCRRRS